jgi:hypothetical protein
MATWRRATMLACSETALVTFRGGFAADWSLVSRLLAIEARGGRFELLEGGRFKVDPPAVLTVDDVAFLRARRDEARQVLAYNARICEDPL